MRAAPLKYKSGIINSCERKMGKSRISHGIIFLLCVHARVFESALADELINSVLSCFNNGGALRVQRNAVRKLRNSPFKRRRSAAAATILQARCDKVAQPFCATRTARLLGTATIKSRNILAIDRNRLVFYSLWVAP